MQSALHMGWTPSEFWAATLHEIELALWVRLDTAERQTRRPAMAEKDMRAFFARAAESE